MKRRLKYMVAAGLAVCAFGGVASAAQAAEIVPNGQAFTAAASDSILEYGGQNVQCTEASVAGKVTTPSANLSKVQFGSPGAGENCSSSVGEVTGISTATFSTPGWSLTAETATGSGSGTGHIVIPSGGSVTVKIGLFGATICTLHVNGAQSIGGTLNASASPETLTVGKKRPTAEENNVAVTSEGALCPLPTSGKGTFSATYKISSTKKIEIK
jgi:hypothetical protein